MTEITISTQYGGSYSPSEPEFWDEIRFELEGADYLLTKVHVETPDEAVEGTFRWAKGNDVGGMEVIRRRNVTSSFDQLDHYLELGRTLLPRAWQLVLGRQFTMEFVRIWTDLQVCHGFLIAHYMDNSDDLTAHRGGEKNRRKLAAQKKWLAHFVAPRLGGRGNKKAAFAAALTLIHERMAQADEGKFGRAWYRLMLNAHEDDFTSSLTPDHFKPAEIFRLAREPADDIPPR